MFRKSFCQRDLTGELAQLEASAEKNPRAKQTRGGRSGGEDPRQKTLGEVSAAPKNWQLEWIEFSHIFGIFTPDNWGNDPIWRSYLLNGWFNHQLEMVWPLVIQERCRWHQGSHLESSDSKPKKICWFHDVLIEVFNNPKKNSNRWDYFSAFLSPRSRLGVEGDFFERWNFWKRHPFWSQFKENHLSWVGVLCVLKVITPPKTNMTMEKSNPLKMYFLLKIGIFQCHVSFQGCIQNLWASCSTKWWFHCLRKKSPRSMGFHDPIWLVHIFQMGGSTTS